MQVKNKRKKASKGFTLLEILLVVAAIAVLAGIVIVAINPSKQLADTRNAQRRSDVNSILNAVYQYSIDNGSIPSTITETPTGVCTTTGAACTAASLIDLGVLTASQKYIVSIPSDPQCTTANSSCYNVSKSANGRITVANTIIENEATISASK